MGWLTRALVASLVVVVVGSDSPPPATELVGGPDAVTHDCHYANTEFVASSWVELGPDLSAEQSQLVAWAFECFAAAGLALPTQIDVIFDSTRSACDGQVGACRPRQSPPEVIVCEPEPTTAAQHTAMRLTLLHELAHVWHWEQGDGTDWLDLRAIVGGEPSGPGVVWTDRTEERVAVAISWGLLDQYRRPVQSELACVELYRQFVGLTGREPLGALQQVCVPDR
jgi:hypothetical protein